MCMAASGSTEATAIFVFSLYGDHPDLHVLTHSFSTRRSSDLSAVCAFPDMAAAVNTVIAIAQSGIPVARMELLDERQMTACNAYSKLDYAVAPTIFFEFHGTPRGVEEQAEMVKALSSYHGAPDFRWYASPAGPTTHRSAPSPTWLRR